jgi:hypothetical protein
VLVQVGTITAPTVEATVRRREFIALLGSVTAVWPLAARAQQAGAMPRIGLLSVFAESDPEGQALIRELMQGLQELGWVNGRDVRIDFRFGGADAGILDDFGVSQKDCEAMIMYARVKVGWIDSLR